MGAPITEEMQHAAAFWAKMQTVTREATRIPKNGYNKAQDYHFLREADVIETMREIIGAAGLAFAAEVADAQTAYTGKAQSGGDKIIVRAWMTFTYVDVETGYERRFACVGDGVDNADKGIYKAITGTTKYHLYKMFLLPTGDDPENEDDATPKDTHPAVADSSDYIMPTGKHKGESLSSLVVTDTDYVKWMSQKWGVPKDGVEDVKYAATNMQVRALAKALLDADTPDNREEAADGKEIPF